MPGSTIRTAVVQVFLATAFSFPLSAVTLVELRWLAGCWRSDSDNPQITEHWMKPAGNHMLAMSHTVTNGKTIEFEFIRIVQEENGDIFFVANPSGQKETRFRLVTLTGSEARFENPDHDFPQRIIYRRNGETLTGRIEGVSKGKERAVDFPLKRTHCDDL